MKQLKSSSTDLRQLFDNHITAWHVAEFLISFEMDRPALDVLRYMEDKDFDVIGVRRDGIVMGYAKRQELGSGSLQAHTYPIETSEVLPDSTPLLATLEALRSLSYRFVLLLGRVSGIVTRGDMQKAPVRMWLFGLITLIEMQMLRLVRDCYPDDSWKGRLTDGRVAKAVDLQTKRIQRGEAINLSDCLQFCDKRDILVRTPKLICITGVEQGGPDEECLKRLETVRDRLVHGQDVVSGLWPELVDLAAAAEDILRRLENATFKVAEAT